MFLLINHFGPIRDTIKSTVAATKIEQKKKIASIERHPQAGYGSVNPPSKIDEQSL